MCILNLSRRTINVHPKVYASLLPQKPFVLLMARFCLVLLILICTSCFTYSVRLFVLTPFLWGLRFMPAGATLQDSRSPAQDPGYQLKSSLASELLSVHLSHIVCISVCMILLLVLEVCGQSVYMGPIRNSVYAV